MNDFEVAKLKRDVDITTKLDLGKLLPTVFGFVLSTVKVYLILFSLFEYVSFIFIAYKFCANACKIQNIITELFMYIIYC